MYALDACRKKRRPSRGTSCPIPLYAMILVLYVEDFYRVTFVLLCYSDKYTSSFNIVCGYGFSSYDISLPLRRITNVSIVWLPYMM